MGMVDFKEIFNYEIYGVGNSYYRKKAKNNAAYYIVHILHLCTYSMPLFRFLGFNLCRYPERQILPAVYPDL